MALFSEAGHALVSSAVAEAEGKTSGEIVTVVADRSDSYSDIALAWAAFVAFTVQTVLVFIPDPLLHAYEDLHGTWNAQWLPADLFGVSAALGILAFLLVAAVQMWDPLRFTLVPGFIKTQRARTRAIALFKAAAERRTHGRTGVLIYLSLREHRAEIVADEAITGKVAADVWGAAMADMLREIAKGDMAAGIAAGVRYVGAVLAEHFPREQDDNNELPDRLIVL